MSNELTAEAPQLPLKLSLIQQEIINNSYDKQQFFNFCIKRKPNGDDLSNWSLRELAETINDFIEAKGKAKRTQAETDLLLTSLQAQQAGELQINMKQLNQQKQYLSSLASSSYIKEIPCKKISKSQLNDIAPVVTLRDPLLVEGDSMLSLNYITYEVQTSLVNWTVRRRYSDFESLRTILAKYYPRTFVPPLPAKKIGSRRFESDFVGKRMKFLQLFLNDLMHNELFKASEPLIVFLSEQERAAFDAKMKEFFSFIPSGDIHAMTNLTGTVLTAIDDSENEKYQTNIENYFYINETLLERLNYNMKYYYKSIASAAQNLGEIQKDFEALHLLNSRVQMKAEITRSYEELAAFFKNWRRILHNENEIFSVTIQDFFKYVHMECTAFKDLIKERKDLKELYTVESARLNAKKEKQWSAMDISKWCISEESMLAIDQALLSTDKRYAFKHINTLETKAIEDTYRHLCHSNRSTIDELRQMIDRYCLSYVGLIRSFTDELYPSLSDALTVWTGLATFTVE